MANYTTIYPSGLYGNAVDDVQVGDLIGKDKIKTIDITGPGIDPETNLPDSLYKGQVKTAQTIGAASGAVMSYAEKLAARVLEILDGLTAGIKGLANYWQFILIGIIALVVLGND